MEPERRPRGQHQEARAGDGQGAGSGVQVSFLKQWLDTDVPTASIWMHSWWCWRVLAVWVTLSCTPQGETAPARALAQLP